MRRGNDSRFLFNEDKTLLAVNLGSDFTAEHEMGIGDIKSQFAIPMGEKDWGIKRRQIVNVPKHFRWTTGAMPDSEGFYLDHSEINFSKSSELRTWGAQTLAGAWDDGSFGVFSSNPDEIFNLMVIYKSFQSGDAVVFLGGGSSWLGNSGLVLAIASRIPAEYSQRWYDADKAAYEIELDVKKSGIRELLAKAGKHYHALSRACYRDGKLTFWLNPMQQQANNAGWYTIDDLIAWTKNKGPIPKTK